MIPTPQNVNAVLDFKQFTNEEMAGIMDGITSRVGPWGLVERVFFMCMWERIGIIHCIETKEIYFKYLDHFWRREWGNRKTEISAMKDLH